MRVTRLRCRPPSPPTGRRWSLAWTTRSSRAGVFLALLAAPTVAVLARAGCVRPATGSPGPRSAPASALVARVRLADRRRPARRRPTAFPSPADAFWLAATRSPGVVHAPRPRLAARRPARRGARDARGPPGRDRPRHRRRRAVGRSATPARSACWAASSRSRYPVADSALLLDGASSAPPSPAGAAGRAWTLIAVGALTLVVGDILWALQAAAGTWEPVMDSNALYPLWPALAAAGRLAAEARAAHELVGSGVRTHAAALVVAVTVGRAARGQRVARVPAPAVVLAGLSLLVTVQGTGRALASSLRAALEDARERDAGRRRPRGDAQRRARPLLPAARRRSTGGRSAAPRRCCAGAATASSSRPTSSCPPSSAAS